VSGVYFFNRRGHSYYWEVALFYREGEAKMKKFRGIFSSEGIREFLSAFYQTNISKLCTTTIGPMEKVEGNFRHAITIEISEANVVVIEEAFEKEGSELKKWGESFRGVSVEEKK
jgi:hypothetical protein